MEQEYFLDTNASKRGVYLNQQQIDLLFIASCEYVEGNPKKQLEEYFYRMCSQFPYQKIEEVIPNYNELDLEESKKALYNKYLEILVDYKTNYRLSLEEQAVIKLGMMRTPDGQLIPEEIKKQVISIVKDNGFDRGITYLSNLYGQDFVKKFNRLMKDDFENVKSIAYEDMVSLHERLKTDPSIDTIIIATGKYDNCMFSNGESTYFDPFFTAKGLAYCKMANKHMRYHALFDYMHLKKLIAEGKGPEDKEQILSDMKKYIQASIEYIEKYNESVVGTNSQRINVVEIFNELVEYNKTDELPYEMAWGKHFGITISDILSCFKDIKKPDGVEFMYNETQLEEHPDRRRKVSEVLTEITRLYPGLIDVFGNQMHLQHTHAEEFSQNPNDSIEGVRGSLQLMAAIENANFPATDGTTKKIRTEITEFDIHLCVETYFNRIIPLLKSGEITQDEIYLYKKTWIDKISELIKESGINVERITYWSLFDMVDHNLVRANQKILENNPDKTIEELEREGLLVNNLYAGALSISTTPKIELSTPQEQPSAIKEIPEINQEESPNQDLTPKEEPKKLVLKPPTIPNSGFIAEYIIIVIILLVLVTLVLFTIISIT